MEIILAVAAIGVALIVGLVIGTRRGRAKAERDAQPMKMLHVFSCRCGHDTKSTREGMAPGAVFTCPNCSQVWAHITPGGYRKWISLSDREAAVQPAVLPGIETRDNSSPSLAPAKSPDPKSTQS